MVNLIHADTASTAWYDAVRAVRAAPGNKIFHLIVSIERPLVEVVAIRRAVDKLLAGRQLQKVDTVANTIMPAALAEHCGSHDELVEKYRQRYDVIMRFPKNTWGTYFGRLVAYPIGHDKRPAPVDQLALVIKALRSTRVIAAQYEMVVATAEDAADTAETVDPGVTIHHPTRGRHGRGGPCLSNIAFQRQADCVHAIAHYRSHYLIERGYGNYLGLGWLLRYVADQAGLDVGCLTVVAGYAQIEGRVADVDHALAVLANCDSVL